MNSFTSCACSLIYRNVWPVCRLFRPSCWTTHASKQPIHLTSCHFLNRLIGTHLIYNDKVNYIIDKISFHKIWFLRKPSEIALEISKALTQALVFQTNGNFSPKTSLIWVSSSPFLLITFFLNPEAFSFSDPSTSFLYNRIVLPKKNKIWLSLMIKFIYWLVWFENNIIHSNLKSWNTC